MTDTSPTATFPDLQSTDTLGPPLSPEPYLVSRFLYWTTGFDPRGGAGPSGPTVRLGASFS